MLSIIHVCYMELQNALNTNRGRPAEGLWSYMATSIGLYQSPHQRQHCCHHSRHVLQGSLEFLLQEESFTPKFLGSIWLDRATICGCEKNQLAPGGPPPLYYSTAGQKLKPFISSVSGEAKEAPSGSKPTLRDQLCNGKDLFLSGVCSTPPITLRVGESKKKATKVNYGHENTFKSAICIITSHLKSHMIANYLWW